MKKITDKIDIIDYPYWETSIFALAMTLSILPEETEIFGQDHTFVFINPPLIKDSTIPDKVAHKKVKIQTGWSNNVKKQIMHEASIDFNFKIAIEGANSLKLEMRKGGGKND